MKSFVIEPRFCGPPTSGNGGYVCGVLASHLGGRARVRLRVPPPLSTPLAVRPSGEGVELFHGETLVAQALPEDLALEPPTAPSFAEAEAAARDYSGFKVHPFPGCFVCGPDRAPGDGLRIFPGPGGGAGAVVAPWLPDASLADASGRVQAEFLWAALDCPGAFSIEIVPGTPVLLGELSAKVLGTVKAGERCVALGWNLGRDGRRHYAGTALFDEAGGCVAVARATWFEVQAPGAAKK